MNKFLDRIYRKRYSGIDIRNDWDDYKRHLKIKRSKSAIKVMVYFGPFGVAYYRVFTPFMELALNPEFDVRVSNLLNSEEDLNWADVLFFQRVVNRQVIISAEEQKQKGKKIVCDVDDFLHGLPDHHPQKRSIENSCLLSQMDELCELCDAMTVSTDYLAKMYRRRYAGLPIIVLPNCVRLEDWQGEGNEFYGDRIFIGWGGSNTHYHDLTIAAPALARIIEEFPNVFLLTINYHGIEKLPYADAFADIPLERRFMVEGTEPHLLKNYIGLIDIGIAPLLANDFNRSKSSVKFLEYSMRDIPMVGSDLEPYQADRDYCILVDRDGWYSALKRLVKERELREHLGKEAHKWVEERYDIKKRIDLWVDFFKQLV